MTDLSDEALARGCERGDAACWEEFTRRYSDFIGRVARRAAQRQGIALGEADVDEMVTGVLESLVEEDYRRLKRYDARFSLAAWVRTIARAHALDALRARRRRSHAESSAPPSGVAAEAGETGLRERIDALLGTLEVRERTILRLYFFGDRAGPEIARLLRIPENTVFSLLRRTLEKLRRGMGP